MAGNAYFFDNIIFPVVKEKPASAHLKTAISM